MHARRQFSSDSYTHPIRASALRFLAALFATAGFFWFSNAWEHREECSVSVSTCQDRKCDRG